MISFVLYVLTLEELSHNIHLRIFKTIISRSYEMK